MSDASPKKCNHCNTPTTSTNPLKNCARCKSVAYCNPTCQKADWPAHKLVCNKQTGSSSSGTDEPIPCVKIHGGPGRYSRTTLKPTHPIFNNPPLPISTKIGFPLVMHRVIDALLRGQETDNVHATWLNIDPVSGFAPEYWQGGIGDVVVAKADKSAMMPDELGGVVDYVSAILDAFGEGGGDACGDV